MRHEYKYLVPNSARETLQDFIGRYADRDGYAQEHGLYTVRSIYLDTSRGAMYRAKKEGVRERVKVRVRGYGDVDPDSVVGLELKRKRGNTSWKSRARSKLDDVVRWLADEVPPDSLDSDNDEAAVRFRYFVRRYNLKPAVQVVYEREAYQGVHDPTMRITFDSGLRGRFTAHLERLGAASPVQVFDRHFILEVKFDYHYPAWLRPALAEFGLQKRALSKYTLTMDACARATHGRRASFSGGRVLRPGLLQTSI